MRDGIELARRKRPTVTLLTQTFESQGDFVAKATGMPDIPRVVLPHPVAGSGAERLREIAGQVVGEIRARLESPAK